MVAWFALVKGEKLWGCRPLNVGCKDDLATWHVERCKDWKEMPGIRVKLDDGEVGNKLMLWCKMEG